MLRSDLTGRSLITDSMTAYIQPSVLDLFPLFCFPLSEAPLVGGDYFAFTMFQSTSSPKK